MVPFKSEVSAMTDPMAQLESLGGHPPVDSLYQSVRERYDRLVSSLNKICRLKALFATADVLLCWTKKTRETLSEVVANKDRFGVEDHLATCKVPWGGAIYGCLCIVAMSFHSTYRTCNSPFQGKQLSLASSKMLLSV